MDKITKNPDGSKFTDSPRTSNVESQIEKFRQETSKKSEIDFINTRKLTIQSTVKHEPHEVNEIDRQISDLESLIKRLQEEIVEMSNNAQKPDDAPPLEIKENNDVKEDKEDADEFREPNNALDPSDTNETNTHIFPVTITDIEFSRDEKDGTEESLESKTAVDLIDSNKSNNPVDPVTIMDIGFSLDEKDDSKESHESNVDPIDTNKTNTPVYPVMVTDIGFSIIDRSQKFDAQVSDLVNFPGAASSDGIPKTFSSIRRSIDELWTEENLNNDHAGENKAKEDDYHLQKLIGELKTEINEKLCSLSDVTERLNNSEENIVSSSENSQPVDNSEPPDPPDPQF